MNVTQNEIIITHICGPANLNLKKIHEYLDVLLKLDLMRKRSVPFGGRIYYYRTEKGNEFMKHYDALSDIIIDNK